MKNFHSKNFKRKFNIFNAELPTRNFIPLISYLYKKKIEPRVFVLSILQFIWQDLSIACKSFNRKKKVCIYHWNLMNEQKQRLKKVFLKNGSSLKWQFWECQDDCMIKIFQTYQWRSSILVKLQTYSLQF